MFGRLVLLHTLLANFKILAESRAAHVGHGIKHRVGSKRGTISVEHLVYAIEADVDEKVGEGH
jgi:hypothetical protein